MSCRRAGGENSGPEDLFLQIDNELGVAETIPSSMLVCGRLTAGEFGIAAVCRRATDINQET
jgi:hypothetical protein